MNKTTRKIMATDIAKLENAGINTDEQKRQLREPILSAFDIYKTNVHYGIILESQEEHSQIIDWYNALCDLDLSALQNIPENVKKYIKKGI